MRLRRFMILVVFCLLGCDDTLQLGTSDGGPMSADGGGGGSGSGSGSGPTTGEAPSAACLGDMAGFGCVNVDGGVDPDTCTSECEAAAVGGCHVDSFTAQSDCNTLCQGCDTQTQVTCLQGTSCSALVSALNGHGTLCGFANAGGASVEPACCAQVCEHAAEVGCNVAQSTADSECVTLCASSPNWSQLNCVLSVPCSMLVGALGGQASICGIGG